MKVWLKLLIGTGLGVALGALLPVSGRAGADIAGILAWLETFLIRAGRYALIPALVFSLSTAVYELRHEKRFWGLLFRSALTLIVVSAAVIALAILATFIFPPARVPILIEEQRDAVTLDLAAAALDLFPSNMFAALAGDGVYLLPACVFAFFLGMGLSYDRAYSKPVAALVDSLSRIFYHVVVFFSEILGLAMIALAAYWTTRFRALLAADGLRDLAALLGGFGLVVGFVVLPLCLGFVRPRVRPLAVVYGSLSQALAAFFSGDINFTLPVTLRQLKDNLGVRRRVNAVTPVCFAVFGRAGSAAVAASAFIVILKSYSSLDIEMPDIVAIGVRAFAVSFLLARCPGDGAFMALAVICQGYGRGFEAGYLILRPMAFYLVAVGALLDTLIATFATFALARAAGYQEDKPPAKFI